MSIYVNLELPMNVKIDFNLIPEPAPTKAARKLEEEEAVAEVNRALNRWAYEAG